jgi:hypothetical protein
MRQDRDKIEQAAFVCITFHCERCDRFLEAEDYPNDGWVERLADRAIAEGWRIESIDRQRCPDCSESP